MLRTKKSSNGDAHTSLPLHRTGPQTDSLRPPETRSGYRSEGMKVLSHGTRESGTGRNSVNS